MTPVHARRIFKRVILPQEASDFATMSMSCRSVSGRLACPLVTAVLSLAIPFGLAGQTPKAWTPASRTADGQPDLQGVWTNSVATPMERPAALAGKEFFTAEEQALNQKKASQISTAEAIAGTEVHYDFSQFGLDPGQAKRATTRRTSLIFDPPDGKIPAQTAAGKQRVADRAARNRGHQFDGAENRPLGERCIVLPQEGPPMLSGAYNNNLGIVQVPGYVIIQLEMIHDARVIPLTASPHLPRGMRQWMGDPRGHWEGNTLVVDSTNFTDRTNFRGSGENLHVVERFTRTGPDTILYQFTLEDPDTWVRPWSAELPMLKTGGPLYEFACHEANYGMGNTLKGARAQDRKDEAAGKAPIK